MTGAARSNLRSVVLAGSVCCVMALVNVMAGQESPGPIPETSAEPKVGPVPEAVRKKYNLDPFYQKYTDYKGFSITSSEKVSDAALLEAGYLISMELAKRDDILAALIKKGARFMVMSPKEMTTDVPEQRSWGVTPDKKDYWDKRARGMGGKLSSCGEENLLNLKGDRYPRENILIHEFGHAIQGIGLETVEPGFTKKLKGVYEKAIAKGLYKDSYASTNHSEYWSESLQSYYDCASPDKRNSGIPTREKLKEYDPDMYELVDNAMGHNPFRYVRYDKRQGGARGKGPGV